MLVGAFSAAKMGTVDPFAPIPSPMMILRNLKSVHRSPAQVGAEQAYRVMKRLCHDLENPEPIGVAIRHNAVAKIAPRRPK